MTTQESGLTFDSAFSLLLLYCFLLKKKKNSISVFLIAQQVATFAKARTVLNWSEELYLTMRSTDTCSVTQNLSLTMEFETKLLTGIIQTRMLAIPKLQNFLRRLHILIASYLTQRREDNMIMQDSRFLSFLCNYFILLFYLNLVRVF